ncbi:TlpA family protein disulfide reductase [Streptomyces apocyni]|uniref:TlpA family protein disulfide reductase n=1 Tax=Streptomyces apocyni TaxID=2654677 RepID=UPI0012E9A83A|nr:TlpA disulfide reductase family protein [Streptomyces apocyni]
MSLSRAPRRALPAAIALAAAGALTLTACGGDAQGGGSGNTNFVTGTDGISTAAKGERKTAPKLDGETLDGEKLDTSDFKGKVLVVNAWGSWCAPCRAEAKYLSKVAKETKDQGVEFVGINTRDPNKGPAIAFEKDYGVPYPSLYDPMGKLLLRFPKGSLNPQTIPTTIVIDRDGKIAARVMKAVDDKQLHEMIDPLIAEK